MTDTQTEYAVQRNVPAHDKDGQPCKIALVLIRHANGFEQTLAINEDLICFAGESMIEDEVNRASVLPSDVSTGNPLGMK